DFRSSLSIADQQGGPSEEPRHGVRIVQYQSGAGVPARPVDRRADVGPDRTDLPVHDHGGGDPALRDPDLVEIQSAKSGRTSARRECSRGGGLTSITKIRKKNPKGDDDYGEQ